MDSIVFIYLIRFYDFLPLLCHLSVCHYCLGRPVLFTFVIHSPPHLGNDMSGHILRAHTFGSPGIAMLCPLVYGKKSICTHLALLLTFCHLGLLEVRRRCCRL
jgi:hypothetical protein